MIVRNCVLVVFFFFLTIGFSLNAADFGGIDGGGGGSIDPLKGTAWFLEDANHPKTVHICIDQNPRFPANPVIIESIVKWAFKSWSDYVIKKNVLSNKVVTSTLIDKRPATQFIVESCSDTSDLRVIIGKDPNRHFKASKSQLGLAIRESYDVNQHWGRGFVWISFEKTLPIEGRFFWSETKLKLALLHEMGHVFGVSHHRLHTIMSGHTFERLASGMEEAILRQYLSIDQGSELATPNGTTNTKYPISLGNSEKQWSDAYHALTGVVPSGKMTASIVEDWTHEPLKKSELILKDDTKEYRFPISMKSILVLLETPFNFGFTFLNKNGNLDITYGALSYGFSRTATLTLLDGTQKTIIYNRGGRPTILSFENYVWGNKYIYSVQTLKWLLPDGATKVFAGSGFQY